jgi:apolipoprotein N-acyltransferase
VRLPAVALPAFLSSLLLWASFAPLGASFLAWLAPIGWLMVIEREPAPGRRGYFLLFLSGLLFWLLYLQGIRLAFWALIFGWFAISAYLAIYIPLFVGITRTMRTQWRWPLFLAAPIAWVGLEVTRCLIFTGFAAGQLGHTQAHLPSMIQISDQFGGYGVSFVMMAVSVALWQLATAYRSHAMRPAAVPVAVAAALLLSTAGYGWWRLRQADALAANSKPLLKVILVQENTPTIFDSNEERVRTAWARYLDVTREAAQQQGVADLVVWPESTFTAGVPWMQVKVTDKLPQELLREKVTLESLAYHSDRLMQQFEVKVKRVLAAARNESVMEPPPSPIRDRPFLLLGCDALIIGSDTVERYNSALLVDPAGAYQDRYDKMHLVMFGEYIPLGPVLKFLADAFQLGSVQPGTDVKSFDVAGVKIAPNICFESMLPELVSWQVRKLAAEGKSPDVLLNLTNDSWFWGSAILDHHLACSIFCAVENRRPLLAAANTGLSAEIDGSGRVLQVSERMAKATLLVEPRRDGRTGLVQSMGYPFAWICCGLTGIALLAPAVRRRF